MHLQLISLKFAAVSILYIHWGSVCLIWHVYVEGKIVWGIILISGPQWCPPNSYMCDNEEPILFGGYSCH